MGKQIKLSEIKSIMDMDGWSNNSFANALCCMMREVIENDKRTAQELTNAGDIETAQIYLDCAESMRERKNNLHDMLDCLGHYDDIR